MERSSGGSGDRAAVFLRYLIVWIVALIAGTIGALPVFVMGLVVPEMVVWPLSFGTGALLAAASALWAGTLLDRGRTSGCPLPILSVCLSTAAVISIV